jgi:hypothetical protein
LLINKGVTVFVRTPKVVGSGIAAHVTINAGRIYIIAARNILFDAVVAIRHGRVNLYTN